MSSGIVVKHRDGLAVFANDLRITDSHGWIDVRIDDDAGDQIVKLRIHAEGDADGGTLLFVDQVVVEGQRYRSVFAMMVEGRERLAMRLAECLHAEITHRLGVPRRSMMSRLRYATEPSYETSHLELSK